MEKTDNSRKMKLKLFVDNKSSKVLFAEADKEFVDFLLSLLGLPVVTVTRLLHQKHGVPGSLGALYTSIESLSDSYIQPNLCKEAVLCPKVTLPMADSYVPLFSEGITYHHEVWYRCNSCRSSKLTDIQGTLCSTCKGYMRVTSSSGPAEIGGYVMGMVKYMVMDDLAFIPMSTDSIISLLNTLNITNVGVLEEMIVILGMTEVYSLLIGLLQGLKLLQAYLHSKTVLTDVFIRKAEA